MIKMKKKITIKHAKEICSIGIGYCKIQHLLADLEPVFYTASKVYGWRSDIYLIDNIYISTGYAPQGYKVNNDLVEKYDNFAFNSDYKNLAALRSEFVRKALVSRFK